ncbi:HalOD1 output domain-containing protein [Haladaptatus salinisoli]|uniref:HalOD1 output domain-containing protein n=1 Tax=Haladaptatus salinisoli TaxID=2884876 RepID=UPI001D0A0F2C|nr:HalOD1 output domain-containing protein [Haladaptatus salinisoli]
MFDRPRKQMKDTQPKASTIIVEALEEYDGFSFKRRDSTLYDFVNPDALNSLFAHTHDEDVSVQFDIHDVTVTVWRSNGEISARVNDQ